MSNDKTAAVRMARLRARQRGEDVPRRQPGRPAKSPVAGKPTWHRELPTFGLDETAVWEATKRTLKLDDSNAVRIVGHAFTEMLNNAIEHSESETVAISWWVSPTQLCFEIADTGVGVYEKVRTTFGLDSAEDAVGEVSKGKRTSAADRHTGEGIFFTSKMVDIFKLSSSSLCWTVDNLERHDTGLSSIRGVAGTKVMCQIDQRTTRAITDVFAEWTVPTPGDEEVRTFDKTSITVKLFQKGELISRSEARRLLHGLEDFSEILLDFTGVTGVGQGFVDEVFRVWPNHHPGKTIRPINLDDRAVRFMVQRGLPASEARTLRASEAN
jgi:anti-sigma regulatory factor (Ser/Thr protein kinase)